MKKAAAIGWRSMVVCSMCCCLSLYAWAEPELGNTLPAQELPVAPVLVQPDTLLTYFYQLHPLLPVHSPVIYRPETVFVPPQQDRVFYWLAGLLLLLGIIRMGFAKYFTDLIRIFTQTALQQKSLREQLVQNRLASLLMNLFFCLSAGTFLYHLAYYKNWLPANTLWWKMLLFCIGFVAALYMAKYISTALSGWLFGYRELSETYNFIVFLVNKVVGIMLLPATVALALGEPAVQSVLLVISLFGVAFLFIYRSVLAVRLLRQHVRIIPIHFFLYLCAFEVIPVLVVYKVMLSIIKG